MVDLQHFYDEIQKVRQRRTEREEEQEEQERLRAEEARLREAEQYHDWHAKEESFHVSELRAPITEAVPLWDTLCSPPPWRPA